MTLVTSSRMIVVIGRYAAWLHTYLSRYFYGERECARWVENTSRLGQATTPCRIVWNEKSVIAEVP